MNILIFILAGLLIAIAFRVLRRISQASIVRESLRNVSKKGLPALELATWIVYAFWGVHVFFGDALFLDTIVVVMVVFLLAALGWYVFRDFLAGVLIRAEKSLEPGLVLRTPSVAGKISKLKSLAIEIVNDDGELVRIPYSRLNQDLIVLPPRQEDNLPHHLEMTLLPGHSPGEIQKRLMEALLAMPWIVSPAPEVRVEKAPGGQAVLHITYHTHLRAHAQLVEEKLAEVVASEAKAPGSP